MTFILGFFSGILALLVVAASRRQPAEKKSRRWTSIESLQYRWSFDWGFDKPLVMRELVAEMPSLMTRTIQQKPFPDEKVTTIDPGAYSVELLVHFRFVGREAGDTLAAG